MPEIHQCETIWEVKVSHGLMQTQRRVLAASRQRKEPWLKAVVFYMLPYAAEQWHPLAPHKHPTET